MVKEMEQDMDRTQKYYQCRMQMILPQSLLRYACPEANRKV